MEKNRRRQSRRWNPELVMMIHDDTEEGPTTEEGPLENKSGLFFHKSGCVFCQSSLEKRTTDENDRSHTNSSMRICLQGSLIFLSPF